jgi:prevent-host-death family protein
MDVGVRELKAKLSEYLGKAASGTDIVVTDRGRPIARLTAIDGGDSIQRGIDEGWIDAPLRRGLSPANPRKAAFATADLLAEDRG